VFKPTDQQLAELRKDEKVRAAVAKAPGTPAAAAAAGADGAAAADGKVEEAPGKSRRVKTFEKRTAAGKLPLHVGTPELAAKLRQLGGSAAPEEARNGAEAIA
jgi:hypothetical protein